jgi:hypothetical protein
MQRKRCQARSACARAATRAPPPPPPQDKDVYAKDALTKVLSHHLALGKHASAMRTMDRLAAVYLRLNQPHNLVKLILARVRLPCLALPCLARERLGGRDHESSVARRRGASRRTSHTLHAANVPPVASPRCARRAARSPRAPMCCCCCCCCPAGGAAAGGGRPGGGAKGV